MTFSLSTSRLNLEFRPTDTHMRVSNYALADSLWFVGTSPLFSLHVNGKRYDATRLTFLDFTLDAQIEGVQHGIAHFAGEGFRVDHHVKVYADTALLESWQIVTAMGETPIRITRMDSFSLDILPADYELLHFSSDWGQEFEPVRAPP